MRQRRTRILEAAVAVGLAAMPLAGAGGALAQAVAEAATFSVPAGSLSSALVAFGRQSGLQVSFAPEIATGKSSPGVAGALKPDAALERLLGGTGLIWRWANDATVTIYDPRSAAMTANAQGTIPLEEIQVTGVGTKSSETAWGPVDGYVATRSGAGSKSNTPIVEIPQSVSVVTRDQMRDRGVQTVTEALQYTPGVVTSAGGKDPRFDIVYLRGFNTQGSGGYRDGMREFADANALSAYRTEPYGLERIDVMRGPGSVLYGQTGPGGVIDKISKRPTPVPFAEFVGTFGNFDRIQGAFDLGGAADEAGRYQFRLTGLLRESDAQIAHFSRFVPDDRKYVAPAFTWQPTADTRWTILTEYQHDLSGNAFPVSRLRTSGSTVTAVSALPLYLGDPNWNKYDHEQYRIASLFEHRFNDVLAVKQNMAFTSLTLDYRYLTGSLANNATTAQRVARTSDDKADTYTLDNQAHANFFTGPLSHAVLVGFDFQRLGFDTVFKGSPGTYALDTINPIYGIAVQPATSTLTSTAQTLQQAGLYAQDQVKLDKWLLTLGIRHDHAELESDNRVSRAVTNTDDTATTKRVGLTYLFDDGVAPYASWATSFLPTTGTDFSGNPFKPTTGRQYEVGVKWQPPGSRTLVTVAAFDIVQQNVLTTDPVNTGFSVQTGEISSRGIEFQATTSPLAGLDLIVSASVQDVEVTRSTKADLGKVPLLIPEQQAAAWAKYTIQSGFFTGLGFGAGVRYIGETWADLANTIPNAPQTVVDAALSYDWKGARFALNVTNLFDREQALCTTSGGCQFISPRTVVGSVRYRW